MANENSTARGHQIERSYADLRELIVDGLLAPGSRVMAKDLADRVGVSRRTVQVVLHQLEADGLLARLHGKQSRWLVPPLTADGFRETLGIIGVLEGWAGRLTAELEPEQRAALVTELRRVNTEFRIAGEKDSLDGRRAGDMDHRFHDLTIGAVAGPQLRETLRSYRPRVERYVRSYMGYLVMTVSVSADEHEKIIDAIERGNADEIERTIRENRWQATERYAEVIDRVGERGTW